MCIITCVTSHHENVLRDKFIEKNSWIQPGSEPRPSEHLSDVDLTAKPVGPPRLEEEGGEGRYTLRLCSNTNIFFMHISEVIFVVYLPLFCCVVYFVLCNLCHCMHVVHVQVASYPGHRWPGFEGNVQVNVKVERDPTGMRA